MKVFIPLCVRERQPVTYSWGFVNVCVWQTLLSAEGELWSSAAAVDNQKVSLYVMLRRWNLCNEKRDPGEKHRTITH